jgi:phosphopantothenoylcysteine decarboxylase / phosphopantothenate---cysteine ligase
MKRKLTILITAGPTREPLDPVRFISNYSTGVMGLELADASSRLGHAVTLVHGPMNVPASIKARRIPFETVADLQRTLTQEVPHADILFMVAAVSDFRPSKTSRLKIKKGKRHHLSLVENPDVLQSLKPLKNGKCFVGFSVESKSLLKNAKAKLKKKGLDLIVAQKVTKSIRPFGQSRVSAMVIDRSGKTENLKSVTKGVLARTLVKRAVGIF